MFQFHLNSFSSLVLVLVLENKTEDEDENDFTPQTNLRRSISACAGRF
jgi:hypothetical protein